MNAFKLFIIFLRSLAFAIFYVGYTLLFGPVALLIAWLGYPWMRFETRFVLITSWVTVIMKALELLCGIKVQILGLENIPAKPCMIMSNHQSTWETLYSYKIFKPQATVLKRELLWIPVFGWGLSLLKPIAIDRKRKQNALKTVMGKAPEAIKDGFWFMVYPEGTRSNPEEKPPFAVGSAAIACKHGIDILPVAHNAGYCWPARRFMKFPGTITMSIGAPISANNKQAKSLSAEVEQWVRKEESRINAVKHPDSPQTGHSAR